mgnify:CR=1 FL=1
MGLLDTWTEWKNDYGIKKPDHEKPGYYEQKQKDLEKKYKTFPVAGGKVDMTINKKSQELVGASQPNQITSANINQTQNKNITPFNPSQGGDQQSSAITEQDGFSLAKFAGISMEDAKENWKNKGGFEGLMSNPAFTLGAALMQSSAQGKSIGAGVLDNFVKAAGISAQFKDRMDARKMEPIQATSGDIAEVKDMLKSINIEEGNWLENFLGGSESGAKYEAAVEEVAVQFQEKIREAQAKLKREGKSEVIRRTDQIQILRKLINKGEIKKKGGFLGIFSATIQKELPTGKARGGPVRANKAYVVGEQGPEYFLPKESGKVVSNDDSRIFAMLLAANPQLQQVSKTRAERIIRSRFPEYFD